MPKAAIRSTKHHNYRLFYNKLLAVHCWRILGSARLEGASSCLLLKCACIFASECRNGLAIPIGSRLPLLLQLWRPNGDPSRLGRYGPPRNDCRGDSHHSRTLDLVRRTRRESHRRRRHWGRFAAVRASCPPCVAHLRRYLDELVFRWNRRRHVSSLFETLSGNECWLGFQNVKSFTPTRAMTPMLSVARSRSAASCRTFRPRRTKNGRIASRLPLSEQERH